MFFIVDNENFCNFAVRKLHMVKLLYIFCLILILFLPSCISDTEIIVPDTVDDDDSNIELILSFNNPTRAQEEREGNIDENFLGINEKDYKVAVFNGDGVYVGNFEPTQTNYNVEAGGNDVILKGYLKKSLVKENTSLQLIMLVNWNTFGNIYPDNFDEKNLADLYNDNVSYNYTMYGLNYYYSWRPNAQEKKGIPMFGVSEIKTLPGNIDIEKDIVTLAFRINLIRCMAKIMVENHFKDNVGEAGYNIKSISLSKYNKKGTLIPHEWQHDSKGVTSPWLPKTESGEYDLNEGTNLYLYKEKENPETWVGYIPEAAYNESDEKPVLNFIIEAKTESINKALPIFRDYTTESDRKLLRNNIYNYEISISEKEIFLDYTVCPWDDNEETIFDYK